MEKNCKTCKHGVPDKHAFDGIRCDGRHADVCIWMSELEKFNKWEPKEEEVLKTYTTAQMIDMLLENRRRKAIIEDENARGKLIFTGNAIRWESGTDFVLTVFIMETKWTIIEPEVEQVDFIVAIKSFKKGKDVKSVVSNQAYNPKDHYLEEVTEEEIDGKWIVKEASV
jgi:hypothetical protein